jgi:hypothetical protein
MGLKITVNVKNHELRRVASKYMSVVKTMGVISIAKGILNQLSTALESTRTFREGLL